MAGFLRRGCGKKPARVPTDEIVPLPATDDNRIMRDYFLNIMFRFDAVLDTEIVRGSLEKLLEREDWRRFGARLRINKEGKLEYHIPQKFDRETRPAIAYHHVKHEMSIHVHPLASRLPRATNTPEVLVNPFDFESLMRRPGGPKRLEDYIYTDEPQISLVVISFHDATLISLSALHTMVDGMGAGIMLRAWNLMLQGRDEQVFRVAHSQHNPVAEFSSQTTNGEKHKLADQRMNGCQMLRLWARHFLWQWLHPGQDSRMLCVPRDFVKDLRMRAIREIAESGVPAEKAFVSEGDVLCAWWAKMAILQLPRNSRRMVCLSNAVGMRPVMSNQLPPNTVYVSNAVIMVHALMSAQDVFEKPLGWIAAEVRKSIVEQGTLAQMQAAIALGGHTFGSLRNMRLFGRPDMLLVSYSNWTKAGLFQPDFSAAVVRGGEKGEGRGGPVMPSYVNETTGTNSIKIRNVGFIVGKDSDGNYWMTARLQNGLWPQVERQIKLYTDEMMSSQKPLTKFPRKDNKGQSI